MNTQVVEEGTVAKLGIAEDKSDSGEHFVSFSTLNNFAVVSTMFTHVRSPPNCQYPNQVENVVANFK